MQWGFGLAESGAPAFSVDAATCTACYWRDTPYQLWLALAVRLGMETVARMGDLSFITADSVTFAREGDVRVLSVCFTHKKQNQQNTPVWVHVPNSGSPWCAYRLMVHVLST